jgi:hypothetical protein
MLILWAIRITIKYYVVKNSLTWSKEREVILKAEYTEMETMFKAECKELGEFIKYLIETKNKNINVKLMEYMRTIHKYDIVFDFNVTEYMTVNKVSWADLSKDIVTAVGALDKSGAMKTSVIVLRRISQGKDGKLDYHFEELSYVQTLKS